MRICVVFNEKAGSAGQLDAVRAALAGRAGVTFQPLQRDTDVKAVAAGCDILAIAGGDGTVHAVINALGPDFPATRLAILPLGTGNDLCRTLDIPLAAAAAVALIDGGRTRRLDAVAVSGAFTGFSINAVTGGFSGHVAENVTSELKAAWGPLAYLRGAVGPVVDPPTYRLTVSFDGRRAETFDAINIVIANGRTAAGGVPVAPRANPEDGKVDVVIVRACDFLDRAGITARLMAGDYHADELVVHRTARHVDMRSEPPLPVSIDGELVTGDHFRFAVVRRAVRVAVGPNYRKRPRVTPHAAFSAAADVLTFGRRVSGPLAAAGVFLLLFALVAVGVVTGGVNGFNAAVREMITPRGNDALTAACETVTLLGGSEAGTLAAVAGLGLIGFGRRRAGGYLLAVLWTALVLEYGLKAAFANPRPAPYGDAVNPLGFSFPSGHAMRAVAVGGAAVVLILTGSGRRRGLIAAALIGVALLVCATRVYLGVHWPADVVGGAFLAAAVVNGWWAAFRPRVKRFPPAASAGRTTPRTR